MRSYQLHVTGFTGLAFFLSFHINHEQLLLLPLLLSTLLVTISKSLHPALRLDTIVLLFIPVMSLHSAIVCFMPLTSKKTLFRLLFVCSLLVAHLQLSGE
jgi:hypothetical protein